MGRNMDMMGKERKKERRKEGRKVGVVAHTCNSSYSGDRDQEDKVQGQPRQKS
jgi:hypothetical protein